MTKAEVCLWKNVLRARKMKGYQFRRQRPVLWYIADFMCKELMLIIEVDGITHTIPEVKRHDTKRQKALEAAGFTVMRFEDDDVLENITGVFDSISCWIAEFEGRTSLMPPKRRTRLPRKRLRDK
jgi:very-short-patch-repair endonuclease